MFKSLGLGHIGIKASLSEGLSFASSGGFQGLDFNITEIADLVDTQGTDYVKGLYGKRGLKIGAWGLPMRWDGSDAEYRQGLEALPSLVSIASELGAFRTFTVVRPTSEERKFRENFKWCVNRLRPVCNILNDHGCSLGLEFIAPQTIRIDKKYGFIYTIDGMLGMCEAVGTENIGLLLDSWHWYTGLGALADLRSLVSEDVVHVHINDAPKDLDVADQIDLQRTLPGETGVIDLLGFFKVLKEIQYDGPVTPEPFSQRVQQSPPDNAVKETGEALDRVWRAAGLN